MPPYFILARASVWAYPKFPSPIVDILLSGDKAMVYEVTGCHSGLGVGGFQGCLYVHKAGIIYWLAMSRIMQVDNILAAGLNEAGSEGS